MQDRTLLEPIEALWIDLPQEDENGYGVKLGVVGFIFVNHNPGQLMPTGTLKPVYRMVRKNSGIDVSWENSATWSTNKKKGL